LRRLTAESGIIASHRDCTRVQDAYSLRCMPQVHGSAREAVRFARSVIERELASVSDNPLVFPQDGAVLSGGNFHGEVLGLALDTLTLGLGQLAGICERRIDRLVNPLTNEALPPFLSPHGGVHSGYMIAQYGAAALASELRTQAVPASVESIPTSGLQEDYNSMAAGSALKARRAVGLARRVVAIELLLAAQALDFRAPLAPGHGSAAARAAVRQRITPLDRDRYLKADLDAALELCEGGAVLAAVEAAIGALE
jgi:histidine ammonia-lyase